MVGDIKEIPKNVSKSLCFAVPTKVSYEPLMESACLELLKMF